MRVRQADVLTAIRSPQRHHALPHSRMALATAMASVMVMGAGLISLGAAAATVSSATFATLVATPGPALVAELRETTTTNASAPPSATAPPPTAAPRHASAPSVPTPAPTRGSIPVGKGMWIWLPERAEGGDPVRIVERALATGLTHVYVRTGSSKMGFHGGPFLDALLPVAHAAGLRVYGWDFPYLFDVGADVARGVAAVQHRTPTGEQIDGFVPDLETVREGVNMNPDTARAYGQGLRAAVGPTYPLVVAVPRPSPALTTYPFDDVVAPFDAIAPMVYWLNRTPGGDIADALRYLARYGKPVIPIGQAYDGAAEGGRPGVPTPDELSGFMAGAEAFGAVGVSFWSWQHADGPAWEAIARSPQFVVPEAVDGARPAQIVAVQVSLTGLGYPAPMTGAWDDTTRQAMRSFQDDHGLEATGLLDAPTRRALLISRATPNFAGLVAPSR